MMEALQIVKHLDVDRLLILDPRLATYYYGAA